MFIFQFMGSFFWRAKSTKTPRSNANGTASTSLVRLFHGSPNYWPRAKYGQWYH